MNYSSSALEAVHRLCTRHRGLVEASARCGCFYCLEIFSPTAISEWVDGSDGNAVTALCPNCGIDSVLPDQPERSITPDLLSAMRAYWFDRAAFVAGDPTVLPRVRLRLQPLLRRLGWAWKPRRTAV